MLYVTHLFGWSYHSRCQVHAKCHNSPHLANILHIYSQCIAHLMLPKMTLQSKTEETDVLENGMILTVARIRKAHLISRF